jgi:hypothetical protein
MSRRPVDELRSRAALLDAPSARIRSLEPRRVGVQDVVLEPGDVLLSLGEGDVSSAIRMLDGGRYSHVALWSGTEVIESTTPLVAEHSLEQSLAAHPRGFVDVYRHRRAQARPEQAVQHARRFVGLAYGYADLVLLALLVSTSKWVPTSRAQLAFLMHGCRLGSLVQLARGSQTRPTTCAGLIAKAYVAADVPLRIRVSTVGRFDAKLMGSGAWSLVTDAKREASSDLEREWRAFQREVGASAELLLGIELTGRDTVPPGILRAAKTARLLTLGSEWSAELTTPRQLEKSPDLKFCGRLYAGKPASLSPA